MYETASPFEWREGNAYFRGLRVAFTVVEIADRSYRIARLEDAAALLDQPDFAKRFVEEDRAPYGVELWPASQMLAQYLTQDMPGKGRKALEIGCGVGLVSIVASGLGWRVWATDREEMSLRFAAYNASINDAGVHTYLLLDWNQPTMESRFDRIFAADVLYQLVDHQPVIRCIDRLLAPGGTAWVADPNRGVADCFAEMARSNGFEVAVRATSARDPTGRTVTGRIFLLRRI